MKIIFTLCNQIACIFRKKAITVAGITVLALLFNYNSAAQCTPPSIPPEITIPSSFTHSTVANGDWGSSSTWAGGNIPSVDNIFDSRIRVTHDVTLESNNIYLKKGSVLYITSGGRLTVKNGSITMLGGNPNDVEAVLIINGALRTSGDVDQNGGSTVFFGYNAMIEIGDELATTAPTVFTTGLFNGTGSATSASFINTKGYRWLENVCLNVTLDLENKSGIDVFINVCAEIGDEGERSGAFNASGGYDASDNGNFQITGSTDAESRIYNSEFYIANGNSDNKRELRSCNTDFRLTNGDFINQPSATITGNNNAIWINNAVNGNITNGGSWSWSTVAQWRTENSNMPSGLSGTMPPESAAAVIMLRFNNCGCPQGGPLPVRKVDLSAVLSGSMVNVNWATYDELNTDHFELERSTDGVIFTTVHDQAAAGNTNGRTAYSFSDNIQGLSVQQAIYYRLRIIDKDGHYSNSSIVMVRLGKASGIQIWPNPVIDKLNMQLTSPVKGNMQVRLLNGTGVTVLNKQVSIEKGNNSIYLDDLRALSPGLYMIELIMNGERIYTNKLIKQ